MESVKKFIKDSAGIFQQMFIQHKAVMLLIEPETGRILFANHAAGKFYGYSPEELENMLISDINILPPDKVAAERMKAVSEERSYFVFIHKVANCGIRTVEVYSSPVIINGKPLLYSIIYDISERRKMESSINRLLEEKELILREAHHSIKNNINAIQSILAIQLESLTNPAEAAVVQVAASRLKSMALLYDKLHFSRNTRELQVGEYFSDLVDEILNLFPNSDSVRVEKNIVDFPVEQHTLFIIGIIINELLTNIMKYAFNPGEKGNIKFSVSLKNGRIIIEILDNGKGLPESFDMKKSTGFGLQLVATLVEQLNGTIRIQSNNGAGFIIGFPQN